ncbi:MAG TPA: hypothetical protein DEB52_16835 [Hyphomonas sp.]|jgi:hypothetical protein|nr:hypothetical protein [Hyphomonas sp.]|tara:strand:+ start:517 stop:915 length:399 start_codon:yes stop_codon:yes gene_type:complete
MTRMQAAKARGVTYDAARKWEWRTGLRFANGVDRRRFREDHLEREKELARALRWAMRHGLCKRDLSRVIRMSEGNVAKHAKRFGIDLPRGYGAWHTSRSGSRIMAALRASFDDPDIPKDAAVMVGKLMREAA